MKITMMQAAICLLFLGVLTVSCSSNKHHEEYRSTLPDTIRFKLTHDQDHDFWPVAVDYIEQAVKDKKQTTGVRTDEVWVEPLADNQGHQVYMKRFNTRDFVEYEMCWKLNNSTQNLDLIKKKIEKKAFR